MTKEILVHGQVVGVYRYGSLSNPWCSNRRQAIEIERRRRAKWESEIHQLKRLVNLASPPVGRRVPA